MDKILAREFKSIFGSLMNLDNRLERVEKMSRYKMKEIPKELREKKFPEDPNFPKPKIHDEEDKTSYDEFLESIAPDGEDLD